MTGMPAWVIIAQRASSTGIRHYPGPGRVTTSNVATEWIARRLGFELDSESDSEIRDSETRNSLPVQVKLLSHGSHGHGKLNAFLLILSLKLVLTFASAAQSPRANQLLHIMHNLKTRAVTVSLGSVAGNLRRRGFRPRAQNPTVAAAGPRGLLSSSCTVAGPISLSLIFKKMWDIITQLSLSCLLFLWRGHIIPLTFCSYYLLISHAHSSLVFLVFTFLVYHHHFFFILRFFHKKTSTLQVQGKIEFIAKLSKQGTVVKA
jgi:hypothetical protein